MTRARQKLIQRELVDLIVDTAAGQGRREVTQLQVRTVLQLQRDITLQYLRDNPEALVVLTGLGTFHVKHIAERRLKSVRTKGWTVAAARTIIGFRSNAELRKTL